MTESKLVFVGGFPGGGTDLTKLILNAHPDIYINGEMPFLKYIGKHGYRAEKVFSNTEEIEIFKKILHQLDQYNNLENLSQDFSKFIERPGSIELIEVLRLCFSSKDTPIWGNKTPQNTENMLTLNKIFPDAYYLIVIRDVRDVCLSWNKKWGRDILRCAHKWAQRMKFGAEASHKIPNQKVFFIRYEDMLNNLEDACQSICEFLGITYSPKMLEYYKYSDTVKDGKINYGKPLLVENKGKWKNGLSVKVVKRIEEISFSTIRLFNYDIHYAENPSEISKYELISGKIKDILSYIFVGNRSSKNNNIRSRFGVLFFEIKKILVNRL